MSDIWIVKYTHGDKVQTRNLFESMEQLKEFKAQSNLQKAIMSYMADHFVTLEQEQRTRQVFEMLDVNGDGQLSREELLEGYKILLGGDVEEAKIEVESTMNQLDMNKNGTIDYKGTPLVLNTQVEFMMANLKRTDLVNRQKLKQAFDFFDAVKRLLNSLVS